MTYFTFLFHSAFLKFMCILMFIGHISWDPLYLKCSQCGHPFGYHVDSLCLAFEKIYFSHWTQFRSSFSFPTLDCIMFSCLKSLHIFSKLISLHATRFSGLYKYLSSPTLESNNTYNYFLIADSFISAGEKKIFFACLRRPTIAT